MANLIVRDIHESLVQALKERAARHGRSAEAEHREILAIVLRRPRERRLAEVLAAMPNVGHDVDFARVEDAGEAQRQGAELIRYRGNTRQARVLERWLDLPLVDIAGWIPTTTKARRKAGLLVCFDWLRGRDS